MNIVKLSPGYYPRNDIGQPISLGKIYVGAPDTDPLVEANQKILYVRQEDGTEVHVSQPVYTNAGGVPVYEGSPVTLLVSGNYSLSVLTSEDVQAYYISTNEDLFGVSSLFKTTTETVVLTMSLLTSNLKALGGTDALIYATESGVISEDLSGGYDLSGVTLVILPSVQITIDTEVQTLDFNIRIEDGGQLTIDEDVTVNGNIEPKGNTSGVMALKAKDGDETLTINGELSYGNYPIFDNGITIEGMGFIAKTYKKTGLTGGASTDLDGIDGVNLVDGDFAFVTYEGKLYFYLLDAEGGAEEALPNIIVPDSNPGTINWVLQSTGVTNTLFPAHYERITMPARSAADTITVYEDSAFNVSGTIFEVVSNTVLDLDVNETWDTGSAVEAASRAGNDYYIYACDDSGTLALLISANSTTPTGYDADSSRKIGGFHCLCADVGTIAGHTLTGYLRGDILPASVWDLNHRPVSEPEGMVYANSSNWIDIYLPSVADGELVSVNGGTIADGTSAEKFHPYKFDQWFARISKKPIASLEFVDASIGSNQETNINGSSDPVTTGGHNDTAGDRMISNIGCEDMCGALYQFGREQGATPGASAWASATDGNDSDVGGEHYEAPERPSFGGSWDRGANCGSRCSFWYISPLHLSSHNSSRGVAEPAR